MSDRCYIFSLKREEDETGVSGTGVVADGCQFPDGTCAMRWRKGTNVKVQSTGFYECIADVEKIHGHDGKTKVIFINRTLDEQA